MGSTLTQERTAITPEDWRAVCGDFAVVLGDIYRTMDQFRRPDVTILNGDTVTLIRAVLRKDSRLRQYRKLVAKLISMERTHGRRTT